MIVRIVLAVIGWALIIVGAFVTPLPIPLGIPMILIGIALVAPTSPFVRRSIAKLRKRYPKVDAALRKAHGRVPRFVQIFIEQTRPERFDEDWNYMGEEGEDEPPSPA